MVTPILDPVEAYALWAAEYPPWAHNPLMQAEERAMLSLLPDDLRGKVVCDAGCGSGRYLRHARRRGAAALIGLDLSEAMLQRARETILQGGPDDSAVFAGACTVESRREIVRQTEASEFAVPQLAIADLNALPLTSQCADLTLCGLTLGHLSDLDGPLSELRRITRPGSRILCSELHPSGQERGWERTFKVEGRRFAVRHHWRSVNEWKAAFRRVGLTVTRMLEPYLNSGDVPKEARFDPAALTVPVALVFELRHEEWYRG